jgi:acyl carrier protein
VEHRMLAHLGREAEARGLAAVAVPFRPTERNRPARRFLERTFGAPAAPEGETVFRLPASSAAAVRFDPEQDGAGHGEDAGSDVERRSAPAAVAGSETFQRIADELTSASAVLQALGRRTRVRPALAAPFVAPRRGVERAIADVWQEVLRVEGIGARDSFRDLGGQSLELVQVHRLLLERLRVDLDITALFQRPTVADLAALVESESPLAAGGDAAGRAERMRAAYVRQAAMRRGARRG